MLLVILILLLILILILVLVLVLVSTSTTVKHEMFGNRFGFGFSGDVFAPSHVTVCADCQDIVCAGVTYERRSMSQTLDL